MKDTPDEIWDIICEDAICDRPTRYFDRTTAVALASTNKQLRRLALPRVYHNIDIVTPKQLLNFFLLLKDVPEYAELVKSLTLASCTWAAIDEARSGLNHREVLEIGDKIGHRLDKFVYLVCLCPFGGLPRPEDLVPFVRHNRSISIRYTAGVLDYHFARIEALLSNASKVEELVLDYKLADWPSELRTLDPQPLPSSLKRLTIFRQSDWPRIASSGAIWISKLAALEELNLQCLTFCVPDLGNLTRSFHVVGANLRRLSLGSCLKASVGEPYVHYENWERGVFAILQLCPRLVALHLKDTVHLRRHLFSNLLWDLEALQYEPVTPRSFWSDHPEANFLGVFKTYVMKNHRLKTVQIAHALPWITRDMESDVVDYLRSHGVDDVSFMLQAPASWALAYKPPELTGTTEGWAF